MADVQVTIGATLDELISQVESAKGAIATIAEAFGVGFSIDALKNIVEELGRMAEHTERLSTVLGISTTSVQQLGLIAKLTGGDADAMAMSLERLQLGLARGQIATSQQAAAAKALGINFQQFIAAKPDEQMNLLADAVSKFADGGTKLANVLLLAGRGAANLIPVLDEGRAGLEAWRQELTRAGAVIDDQTIKSLAEMDRRTTVLHAAITGLSATIFGRLAPSIAAAEGNMTAFIARMNEAIKSGSGLEIILMGLAIAGNLLTGNYVGVLAGLKELRDLLNDFPHLTIGKKPEEGSFKPPAPAPDLGAAQRMKDALSAAQEAMKLADLVFRHDTDAANAAAKMYQITENQKTQALIAAVNGREAADLAALNAAELKLAKGSAEFKRAEDEKTQVLQKAVNDRARIEQQAQEKQVEAWKSAADTIAGYFNAEIKGILDGTESFAKAMQNIFAKMIEAMISEIIKLALEEAAFILLTGAPVPVQALLPKFDVGTPMVEKTGMAMVHRGEAIIPAQANPFNASGGGATNNFSSSPELHVHISAMDAASVQQLFTSRGHEIVNWLTPHLTRPSFNGQ